MNNILVNSNRLDNFQNSSIDIKDNCIYFNKNGEYKVIYNNTSNTNITYVVEDNAEVSIYEYINISSLVVNKIKYVINKNSILNINRFVVNPNLDEEIIINLNKEGSLINYHYSSICKNKENHHIIINHNSSKTVSNIINKSLGKGSSMVKFVIDSYQDKSSFDCVMNQETKIITDNSASCTIEPNMYIDNNEVEAKHSSYMGKFSEEDLFYLMTKGLTKEESTLLLAKGYILSNICVPSEYDNIVEDINKYWR